MGLIDEVRDRLDISEVVARYVDLDTRSKSPKALCPFHLERTPSFVVFPDSGRWRCFGACGTGGDALGFLMRQEGLSFADALRQEASRLGIQSAVRVKVDDHKRLIEANEQAARYFRNILEGPRGLEAREYLNARGISMDIARRRGVGLSPSGIETLGGHLRSAGVSGATARDAGLVSRARDGTWRDLFRGRLTIEIRDGRGRLCGFGGRSLDGSEPKYLNTVSTKLFDKSNLLFGLNWATDRIQSDRQAVVVEGYMDALTAHEHGFQDVVASMGTAVSPEQITLLLKTSQDSDPEGRCVIIFALDADTAGQEATYRGLEKAWLANAASRSDNPSSATVELKVAQLPAGRDPDEIIRESQDIWVDTISAAVPMVDYMLSQLKVRFETHGQKGVEQSARSLVPVIIAIENQHEQERALTNLANLLGVTTDGLKSSRTEIGNDQGNDNPILTSGLKDTSGDSLERHLLSLVLNYPDLREYAIAVPPEQFHQSGHRAIFDAWRGSTKLDRQFNSMDEPMAELIVELKTVHLPPADQETMVQDITHCVLRLHERHLRYLKFEEERVFGDMPTNSDKRRAELEAQSLETNAGLKAIFAKSGVNTSQKHS